MKWPPGIWMTSYDAVNLWRTFSNSRGEIMSCVPANATLGTVIDPELGAAQLRAPPFARPHRIDRDVDMAQVRDQHPEDDLGR